MAGISIARDDALNDILHRGVSLYVCLLLLSGGLAMIWKASSLPTSLPQTFPIHFYQHIVSTNDGRACSSYPVCSAYAREAFDKHGWLMGSWFMLDRLIHEADDVHGQHLVVVDGEKRFYDPLKRNDFWW